MKTSLKLGDRALAAKISFAIATALIGASAARAQQFTPGDLLVTTSTYAATAGSVTVGQALPGGGNATANGSYSGVFNNETPDASFGITSPITLEQMTTSGSIVSTLGVAGAVTSFSSKSEMALNLSSDGTAVSFMGYIAPVNALDVSNSNTSAVVDSTNPVAASYDRAIITVNANGTQTVTPVTAYSGNNGRAAVLVNGQYYMVGNAGNGGKTGPVDALSANTGIQTIPAGSTGATTVVGQFTNTSHGNANGDQYGFSVTQIGDAADKTGKEDNFRGLTVFNNTMYVTKGSGSNGVNTVYQVGATGSVNSLAANASTTAVSILPGFSTTLASGTATAANPIYHPFGVFFANANTMYVADEGSGSSTDFTTQTFEAGGLQKWSLVAGTWKLDYTLTAGLNLGQSYTVSGSVTDSTGSVTQQTDGLRNLTGVVNANGTVSLYAITSTVGGLNDSGADPNKLVAINDTLGDTSSAQAAGEGFSTLQTAAYGQVLRGVSFAPVPLPAAAWFMLSGLGGLGAFFRRRKTARLIEGQPLGL